MEIESLSLIDLSNITGGSAPDFWGCLSDIPYCAGYWIGRHEPEPGHYDPKPDCRVNPIHSQFGCH